MVPDCSRSVPVPLGPPPLTDADIAGLLGDLHLHVTTQPLGSTLAAVPGPHGVEVPVGGESLVERRDGGRGH